MSFFCVMGNFVEIFHYKKKLPGRIALRRNERCRPKRPAAGGESCRQDFLLLPENGKEEQRWIKMIILL